MPAPLSTETVAPRAMNFFTVSGVAETRLSPAARSRRTAIFIPPATALLLDRQNDDENQRANRGRGPLHQIYEAFVSGLGGLDIVRRSHVLPQNSRAGLAQRQCSSDGMAGTQVRNDPSRLIGSLPNPVSAALLTQMRG